MRLLNTPFESERAAPAASVVRPVVSLGVAMVAATAVGRLLEGGEGIATELGRALQGAAIHGAVSYTHLTLPTIYSV